MQIVRLELLIAVSKPPLLHGVSCFIVRVRLGISNPKKDSTMPSSQIGAQLYTLRDYTKTPADIASTMKRVKKMGYNAVQCSALGPIDPKELAKILSNEGLSNVATHVKIDDLEKEPQRIIDEHELWGCKYTAIGGFGWQGMTVEGWHDFAKEYNAVAANLGKLGLQIGYHNHSHELVKYNGQTALDLLVKELSKSVWMEIDTYWITHGGGDPIAWVNKVAGRIPCIHLKDMSITPERKQLMAEVGEGNLNFPGILEAAKKAGTQWFIIEQDDTNGRDPFESLDQPEECKGDGDQLEPITFKHEATKHTKGRRRRIAFPGGYWSRPKR